MSRTRRRRADACELAGLAGANFDVPVLGVAEDDDEGVTVIDEEFLAVLGQGDAVLGGVTRSWP